jgi:hypothetical protein
MRANMRCLSRATSNFTAASHRHAVTQAVGKHVRRGAQQLSPLVGCHEQQGTGGDMLHVAVREFAGGGESLLLGAARKRVRVCQGEHE